MKTWYTYILEMFNTQINKFFSSFDTHSKGASARKLTAFWMIAVLTTCLEITYLVWAYKNGNFELLTTLVEVNILLAAVCLGLVTYESLNKKKSLKDDKSSDNPDNTNQ